MDGTGYITKESLRLLLGDEWSPDKVEAMFKEADAKNDGRIDFEEFRTILTGHAKSALKDVFNNSGANGRADGQAHDGLSDADSTNSGVGLNGLNASHNASTASIALSHGGPSFNSYQDLVGVGGTVANQPAMTGRQTTLGLPVDGGDTPVTSLERGEQEGFPPSHALNALGMQSARKGSLSAILPPLPASPSSTLTAQRHSPASASIIPGHTKNLFQTHPESTSLGTVAGGDRRALLPHLPTLA